MGTKIKNQIYLIFFCTMIGLVTGAVIYLFLKVMSEGIYFLWEWIPNRVSIPGYTILVCAVGGILIGLFRKKYGDYPEELFVVIGKLKRNKTYEYRYLKVIILAALMPLLIGSSVGPEAGLTGIVVGLFCWAGENMKFARKYTQEYSELGTAVTLSVLFHAPLFGIFAVEEREDSDEIPQLTKSSKLLVYGVAVAAGTGLYLLLVSLFGRPLGGIPTFESVKPMWQDYLMMIPYLILGCSLAGFCVLSRKGCTFAAEKIPAVWRETAAGICLGAAGMAVPAVMFSGEAEMAHVMVSYGDYVWWMLIAIAFFKVFMTNLCIQWGLRGGQFFPLIFAGVALGYGTASLIFPDSSGHVVIAAAVVTASLLGAVVKKPLAVTMLLFLCFPAGMLIWIFLAAVLSSKIAGLLSVKKELPAADQPSTETQAPSDVES